jgi:hypothetical protein
VTTWDEQTRASAIAAGMSPEEIDRFEAGLVERQAREQAIAAENQSSEVLRGAFSAYYDGTHEPGEIAAWVEQNGGRAAADVFLEQWRADEGEFEPVLPETPDEFVMQRQAQDAQLEQVAELTRRAMADAEQQRRDNYAETVAQQFTEQHPDAAQFAPLVLDKLDMTATDPAAALESAYATAKQEHAVGELATVHAAESQPFTNRSIASNLTRPGGLQFPGIEDVQAKADRLHAESMRTLATMPAPMTEAEESASYAASWAAKSNPRFDGALEIAGASTKAERDARRLLNRSANTAAAVAERQDGARNRLAAFHESSEQASRTPIADSIPDAASDGATQPVGGEKSPKTWW